MNTLLLLSFVLSTGNVMLKTTFLAHFAQAHLVPYSKLAFDASHFTVFLHNLVVCLEFIALV